MADLSRWNPFKFRRKRKDDAESRAQGSAPIEGSSSPRHDPVSSMARAAFESPLFRDPFALGADLDRWFGDFSPAVFSPTIDVVDEEVALRVSAELPGLTKDDVTITVDDDALTIRGEKRNEEESRENGCYRTERSYGMFQRTIPLPRDVDRDDVEARFDNGVLTVRLKKTGEPTTSAKRIPIR